mmetsp:Transcript_11588/g.34983  ORF Transcript_11588/g.34983 Transcript_11588/m.34983 type:complete len:239 (-) Transcript_11588:120-836(-)
MKDRKEERRDHAANLSSRKDDACGRRCDLHRVEVDGELVGSDVPEGGAGAGGVLGEVVDGRLELGPVQDPAAPSEEDHASDANAEAEDEQEPPADHEAGENANQIDRETDQALDEVLVRGRHGGGRVTSGDQREGVQVTVEDGIQGEDNKHERDRAAKQLPPEDHPNLSLEGWLGSGRRQSSGIRVQRDVHLRLAVQPLDLLQDLAGLLAAAHLREGGRGLLEEEVGKDEEGQSRNDA